MALDFISLLLSKDAPKQAELTMSPHLKQFVKPGTLGMDMWQNMPVDQENMDTDNIIARGYRLDSLQTCADSLLSAASRLEKTVQRETRYWENVLSVSERGWSICRMPREKHNLGVRFGFMEAYGEYRDRGMAALRAGESGNVILDKGFGHATKVVRVRTELAGDITGSSRVVVPDESGANLEARIRAARDSLYEEELFHEMIRESRALASYGVDMRQSTIRFPTRLDSRDGETSASGYDSILIDLVALDDMDAQPDLQQHDEQAEAIAVAFRLLLSHAHGERLKRRSVIPPPMSLAKKKTAVASILRPVMSLLHHQSIAKDMDTYLERVKSILRVASIEVTVGRTRFDRQVLKHAGSLKTMMEAITSPVHSHGFVQLKLPKSNKKLKFDLQLSSSSLASTLGARVQLSSPVGLPSVDFTEISDLFEYLDAMIGSALALGIVSGLPGWNCNERLGVVFKDDYSSKVAVEVSSAMTEADGGRLMLNVGGEEKIWKAGGEKDDSRRFWDVVGQALLN